MPTLVHRRVAAAHRGESPTVICRVRSGWIVLGDNQILRGYSLLLADPIVGDLNALPADGRAQFGGPGAQAHPTDAVTLPDRGNAVLARTRSAGCPRPCAVANPAAPAASGPVAVRSFQSPRHRRHLLLTRRVTPTPPPVSLWAGTHDRTRTH
jgi:hypothetical protein